MCQRNTSMTSSSFWESVNILITKFNVVNKRLWGCNTIFSGFFYSKQFEWSAPTFVKRQHENENHETYLKNVLRELDVVQMFERGDGALEIILIELLPKSYTQTKAFQLAILERYKTKVTFYDITPENYIQSLCPNFQYSLVLKNNILSLNCIPDIQCKSYAWLANNVLPQFIKWGEENPNSSKFCNASLSLISTDKYYKKYNELKLKYGKEMVKVWPEVTDPSKYVYEDVAIASYLLLLWEEADREYVTKTFVDLGCGNGLLVYILTQEGHKGIGIDVRKRQIWDKYPCNVKLKVKTIIPSDFNLFPEADWLIGNHSDELTPWIPVIAARSSFKCKFFLLPCCAYNFNGSKYQRRDSSKSQYTEYLEYIRETCEACGFETSIDRLKIPSTKRICLVGQKRLYDVGDQERHCNDIDSIISRDSVPTKKETNNTTAWSADFKARDLVDKVRNCTQIDKSVIDSIVNRITKFILEGCSLETEWSCGKLVDISDLILLLSKDQLKAMKAECGGLQTLLRNNHQIFKVQSGKVQLRYPKTIGEVNKDSFKTNKSKNKAKVKQKPCWFHNNHPQGCPLTDDICSFIHGS